MQTKLVHNVETNEIVVEELTSLELEDNLNFEKEHQAELQKKAEKAALKADLLQKLGITESEAKLLLS